MLSALGSTAALAQKKPGASVVGTPTQQTGAVKNPYVGKASSYTGTTAITPVIGGPQGRLGKLGTRAAEQAVAKYNADNGLREINVERPNPSANEPNAEDLAVQKLDTLASRYNSLVQQYREQPIVTDTLTSAMKEYWDALATTQLPSNAAKETQIMQEMVRQGVSAKPTQELRNFHKDYFGSDRVFEGNDYNYERYSPITPYIDPETRLTYTGSFQRDYVDKLLQAGVIPTRAGDVLAIDQPIWRDFSRASSYDNVVGKIYDPQRPNPILPQGGLKFQGTDILLSDKDMWYNPRDFAIGQGNIYYDVFGGRAANSGWGHISDNGLQDLAFPDAPYTRQGYAGKWIGKGTLNTTEKTPDIVVPEYKTEGYTIKNRTLADDVPILPKPGERQALNQKKFVDPIETQTEVPGVSLPGYTIPGKTLANLTPWKQAHQTRNQSGAVDPRLSGRSPMFDVPQNYAAIPFPDTDLEPMSYYGEIQPGYGTGFAGIGMRDDPTGGGLIKMVGLGREFNPFTGQVETRIMSDGAAAGLPFVGIKNIQPSYANYELRKAQGYGV